LLRYLIADYPSGTPGASLLLLRAACGAAILIEGWYYLAEHLASVAIRLLGVIAVSVGGMLLVGFLTPFATAASLLGVVGVAASWLPACSPNLLDSKPPFLFAFTMMLAILGSGPGRFSLDARLYGRREIIIPSDGLRGDTASAADVERRAYDNTG
jgi:hypothetical protein